MKPTPAFLLALIVSLGGCGPNPGSASALQLDHATDLTQNDLAWRSTVHVEFPEPTSDHPDQRSGCTGTIVAPRFVLTASHCVKNFFHATVFFYSGATQTGMTRGAVNISLPPHVNPTSGERNDSNGKFADIAVIELDAAVPEGYTAAELPASYVGKGTAVWEVGTGDHDGQKHAGSPMRWLNAKLGSDTDANGDVFLDNAETNPGDSGGPLYTLDTATNRLVVQGALFGSNFAHGPDWRSVYTSTSFHLGWILAKTGFASSYYGGFLAGKDIPGHDYRSFVVKGGYTNEDQATVCAYACSRESQCVAFTYVPPFVQGLVPVCWLKTGNAALTTGDSRLLSGIKP